MINLNKQKGFTLIELLVVIAIIGLLSSVVLASLNSARASARDAKRKAEMQQIKTAMELYYNNNGRYQVTGSGWANGGYGWFNCANASSYVATSVAKALVNNKALSTEIVDPRGSTCAVGGYLIDTRGNGYTIWAMLENPTAADIATKSSCYHSTYDSGYYSNYCVSI